MRFLDFLVRTLMVGGLLYISLGMFTSVQERRVERARCKRTGKARQYQALMRDLPDCIWPDEIYAIAFKF